MVYMTATSIQTITKRDEEYYLSIDSHTRFTEGWDVDIITLLHRCPSRKPILTGYPAGYELPNVLSTDTHPPFLCAKGFGPNDGMLRLHGKVSYIPDFSPSSFLTLPGTK